MSAAIFVFVFEGKEQSHMQTSPHDAFCYVFLSSGASALASQEGASGTTLQERSATGDSQRDIQRPSQHRFTDRMVTTNNPMARGRQLMGIFSHRNAELESAVHDLRSQVRLTGMAQHIPPTLHPFFVPSYVTEVPNATLQSRGFGDALPFDIVRRPESTVSHRMLRIVARLEVARLLSRASALASQEGVSVTRRDVQRHSRLRISRLRPSRLRPSRRRPSRSPLNAELESFTHMAQVPPALVPNDGPWRDSPRALASERAPSGPTSLRERSDSQRSSQQSFTHHTIATDIPSAARLELVGPLSHASAEQLNPITLLSLITLSLITLLSLSDFAFFHVRVAFASALGATQDPVSVGVAPICTTRDPLRLLSTSTSISYQLRTSHDQRNRRLRTSHEPLRG